MTQVNLLTPAVDTATHSAHWQNTRAIYSSSSARSLEAESATKERTEAMSRPVYELSNQPRHSSAIREQRPNVAERRPHFFAQIRTNPNKSEQAEHRALLKPPRDNRKNLKKPERIWPTIPSKTLGIRVSHPRKKIVHLKPENRRSCRQTPGFFFLAARYPDRDATPAECARE